MDCWAFFLHVIKACRGLAILYCLFAQDALKKLLPFNDDIAEALVEPEGASAI